MHIAFLRQDLQDNHDIFCLSGRKAKIPSPLRGPGPFSDTAKVRKRNHQTSSASNGAIIVIVPPKAD
jgi:hypothetical protein